MHVAVIYTSNSSILLRNQHTGLLPESNILIDLICEKGEQAMGYLSKGTRKVLLQGLLYSCYCSQVAEAPGYLQSSETVRFSRGAREKQSMTKATSHPDSNKKNFSPLPTVRTPLRIQLHSIQLNILL